MEDVLGLRGRGNPAQLLQVHLVAYTYGKHVNARQARLEGLPGGLPWLVGLAVRQDDGNARDVGPGSIVGAKRHVG